MFDAIGACLQFDFWRQVGSLAAGVIVLVPCLLVPSWRRKVLQRDLEVEMIGFIALIVLLVAVGCYNAFDG